MNRRGFLRSLVGGVAATAAVRTFPFRVFSFPAEIRKPTVVELAAQHMDAMSAAVSDLFFADTPFLAYLRRGAALHMHAPNAQVRLEGIQIIDSIHAEPHKILRDRGWKIREMTVPELPGLDTPPRLL